MLWLLEITLHFWNNRLGNFSQACGSVVRRKGKELRDRIKDTKTEVMWGMDGLIAVSVYKDVEIRTAIVGMIGIRPTIEAIKAGKHIALANKETLVTAGHIIMPLAKEYGVSILPVDSEHSAIFQSLQRNQHKSIHKILLTASGGPFRGKKEEDLLNIKVEDALKHPNWTMGQKITIDSSTMINKGLEVIEAKWLFDVDVDQVQVVVQPQSIIHLRWNMWMAQLWRNRNTGYEAAYPVCALLSGEKISSGRLVLISGALEKSILRNRI